MTNVADLSESQPEMVVRVEVIVDSSMKRIVLYVDCNGVTKKSFGIIFHRRCYTCGEVKKIEEAVKALLKERKTQFGELSGGALMFLVGEGIDELSPKKKQIEELV
jgi:hypothetical protein